jgi:hypothetical protein
MSQTKTHNNADTAVAYDPARNDKNVDGMAKQLHPNVELISPMDHLKGKDGGSRTENYSSPSKASRFTRKCRMPITRSSFTT